MGPGAWVSAFDDLCRKRGHTGASTGVVPVVVIPVVGDEQIALVREDPSDMIRAAVAEEQVGASLLPGLNTLIRVTVGSSADPQDPPVASQVPSRVEDLVAGEEMHDMGWPTPILWIAPPHYSGDVEIPERGTACTVSWPTPAGIYQLNVTFEGRDLIGPTVRAWRLQVSGPSIRAQRRRYVRVLWTGPVALELPSAPIAPTEEPGAEAPEGDRGEDAGSSTEEPRSLSGAMVDLSEGGLRCLLPPPLLRTGQRVRITLPVAGQLVETGATLVWTKPRITPVGTFAEAGFSFDDPEEHGDFLRRVVFGEQLRTRRAGLI